MKYSYEELDSRWNAYEGKLFNQSMKLESGLWLQKTGKDSYCLAWREKEAQAHTWVYVYQDGTYQCMRPSANSGRSIRCLQEFFGPEFRFKAYYPKVLGIEGWATNLHCVWTDSSGRVINFPRVWIGPYSYEQLTAGLACQILHYCRLGGYDQPETVFVWRNRHGIKLWPSRHRALANALKALLGETGTIPLLERGEQLWWRFPDLAAREEELKQLAGDLGYPSTRHLQVTSRGVNISVPSLDNLDFSKFPRCFGKVESSLFTQICGDRVQILNRSTKALLAEVKKDRSLVLWDVSSAYARRVHIHLEPSLKRFEYTQRRVCYLRLPGLDLYGPVFNGCHLSEGVCTNPLVLWPGELGIEDLGRRLRRFLLEWFVENLAKLSPIELSLEVTLTPDKAQVFCANLLWLPDEAEPLVKNLHEEVEVWYRQGLKGLTRTLSAHFSCQALSIHDALVRLESWD